MAYPGPTGDLPDDAGSDATPAGGDDAVDEAPETPNDQGDTVTLDKTNPDIAAAFANCKVGDVYRVTEDTDDSITLAKDYSGEEGAEGDDGGGEEPKGAVAILMAKKKKM